MDKLESDILDAIKSNLPSMQADVLVAKLNQAARDEQDLEDARSRIKILAEQNAKFVEQVQQYTKAETLMAQINKKIEDVDKRERNLTVTGLEVKLEAAEKRADMVQNLVKILFTNQEISTFRNGNMPVRCNVHDYIEDRNYNEHEYKTKHKPGA